MLKTLRLKFILICMGSLAAALLLLGACINVIVYSRQMQAVESTISSIAASDGRNNSHPHGRKGASPETPYMTRFFVVQYPANGGAPRINTEFIGSVSQTQAKKYADSVRGFKKESGFMDEYRYRVIRDALGTEIIFLNCSREFQTTNSLMIATLIGILAMMLLVFIPVWIFSSRAVSPVVNNIERQKRFITDASHEIKTPLTSISTSADILSMKYGEDEWIGNIQKQSLRLGKLVSGLITLSRLDEPTPFPEQSDFSLSDTAWEAAESFSALAAANGKKYTQSIEDGISFHGSQSSIQQMFSVLLDNAIKHSDDGGEIRFSLFRRKKKIHIEVFNTCGELTDTDNLDKWFDRFYRPDQSRSNATGGTGIGLSIVQSIVEAHNGHASVSSPDGHSVCIEITF